MKYMEDPGYGGGPGHQLPGLSFLNAALILCVPSFTIVRIKCRRTWWEAASSWRASLSSVDIALPALAPAPPPTNQPTNHQSLTVTKTESWYS